MLAVALGVVLGNAATATKLANTRQINGTNFNGTENITTSKWGTARTIGLSGAVSGSASIDGSGNVTISTTNPNIAVLSGNISVSAQAKGTTQIDYPSGFTSTNCVVASCGIKVNNNGYNFEGHYVDSGSIFYNSYDRDVNLMSSQINLQVSNPNSQTTTFSYKILLIKV